MRQMHRVRWLLIPLIALLVTSSPGTTLAQSIGSPRTVTTGAIGVGPFAQGAVVALTGTPHLWVADALGTLHWVADTRALANRTVEWSRRTEVSAEQLRTLPRGEPWLSAGFVAIGDAVHLAQWDAGAAKPELRRVQSVEDLELFGVNQQNYADSVLRPAAWEQRFGIGLNTLAKGELPRAISPTSIEPWSYFASPAGGFAFWAPATVTAAERSLIGQPVFAQAQGFEDFDDEFLDGEDLEEIPPEIRDRLRQQMEESRRRAEENVPKDVHVFVFGNYLDGPGTLYVAGSLTLPVAAIRQLELVGPDALFEQVREGVTAFGGESTKLTTWRSIVQGTRRGREFELVSTNPSAAALPLPSTISLAQSTAQSVSMAGRIFLLEDKAYFAAVLRFPAAPASPHTVTFLNSFQFLP